MKTRKNYLLFFLLFLIPGCITDQKVTTFFSADGTVTRIVTFTSDEEEFDLSDLNIPVDSTWDITIEKDTADTSKYFVSAQKSFDNFEALNILYDSLPHNFSGIHRKIIWEKKFRWFYTYYTYRETVNALFHQRPMSDFLNEEEIRYALAGDDERDSLYGDMDTTALKELDERVDENGWRWIAACTFDELYKGLVKTAEEHPSGEFNATNLDRFKDSLYVKFDNVEDSAFNTFFTGTFGIPDPDSLVDAWPENFTTYRELEDVVGRTFGEEYENRISMPGSLVSSNAEKTEEGVLSWQVTSMKFLGNDFVMEAMTRQKHSWAFYVAGLIVLLAAILWFVPRKKIH